MKKKFLYSFMVLAITLFSFVPIVNAESIGKESTIYAGEILVEGNSRMTYLYSSDFSGSQAGYDALKAALPDKFSNLLPDNAPGQGGLTVSSSHQSKMNSSWTNSDYVAEQFFNGEIGLGAESNLYDESNSYKTYIDNQNVGTISINKRLFVPTGVDGEYEAVTVIYRMSDLAPPQTDVGTNAVHTIFFGQGGAYTAAYKTVSAQEHAKQDVEITNSGFFDVPEGETITLRAVSSVGYSFKGWYSVHEVDTDGQGHMEWQTISLLESEDTFTFTPNGETPYIMPVFEQSQEKTTYTLDDEAGNQIIFKDEAGRILVFNSTELMSLTDEQLAEIAEIEETTVEELKALLTSIIDSVKKSVNGKGVLLKVYNFSISDGSPDLIHYVDGGFKIRIKITDDMKGYDKYTLYYLNDEYEIEETVELTKNGDYFEGLLPHLSGYALVGSNETTNPDTGDNVIFYFYILGLSLMGLIGSGIYLKRVGLN